MFSLNLKPTATFAAAMNAILPTNWQHSVNQRFASIDDRGGVSRDVKM